MARIHQVKANERVKPGFWRAIARGVELFDTTILRKVVPARRIREVAGNGVTDFALPKLAPVRPEGPFYDICIQGGSEPRRA